MKNGTKRGVQQYLCATGSRKNLVKCWEGQAPIDRDEAAGQGIDKKASQKLHKRVRKARDGYRYVITAAQNATPVNAAFFASLQVYCQENDAQLLVIPYRYKNPTSQWSEKAQADDWWAPELVPHLLAHRTEIGAHVTILADIMTQPTATNPTRGFESIAGARSAIIGHPKLELTTVPTPQQKLPKILTTTGAVTEKNYIQATAGKKGEFHHTFGACVLEIDGVNNDDAFHMRQINAVHDGSFMDLDREYRPGGCSPVDRAAGIVLGDEHLEFADPQVVAATFGKGGIVETLRPKFVVRHDVHDFYSRNHHHRFEPFVNFAKHHAGKDNVERALDECFDAIDRTTPPGTINVLVPSNHPDALARWVKETDPRTDPENAVFWARTFEVMCLGSQMTEVGVKTVDPFVYWARKKLTTAAQARFLARDESFAIEGIEVGFHGDRGANGARGSRMGFSKIGVKTIIGHSHSPGIREGCYQVGTSSRLRLEYNSGPSSWLHTHCVIYANGKRSLINIIGGKWRTR
jgi:hypothetical protein